ncbi:MAG TPA: 2-phospho-L-lactate guanylyltransferase [Ornithinibacter sp.]|nr:2-phospho-L-lactate guanylyltransferase [Ornithinibacter sp.]
MHDPQTEWAAVVPVKGGPLAKSRLDLPRAARASLAQAFARDTVGALRAARPRMPVLVVTSDAGVALWAATDGARLVPDPGLGLDAAVAAGCRAAAVLGARRIAVVLGDHPALLPGEVGDALEAAARHPACVVPDAGGDGTALLSLTVPVDASTLDVRTAFGSGSAAAHEGLGHIRLDLDLPGLRVDVDDAESLAAAVNLGVGPHSRRALAGATVRGVQATIHRIADDGSGSALLDDGVEVQLPPAAAAVSGLRHLRVGQRVSIELDASGLAATRVWIVGIGPGEDVR